MTDNQRAGVGASPYRIDGKIKTDGKAEYIQDMDFAGLLEAAILPSPYASARIRGIDCGAALAVPGVAAVITGADVPGFYGTTIQDRPVLARERVRYVGEPVAAVAARGKEAALMALNRILVDYEETAAVFDPEEAADPTAPLLHEDLMTYEKEPIVNAIAGTNICSQFRLRKGDMEKGLALADLTLEESYEVPRNHHACLEPYGVIAQMEREGILHIWTGNQSPYVMQRSIAALFGLTWNQVRVSIPALGGGFGSKIYPSLEPLVVALARKTNHRPVRLLLDREEDFCRVTNHGCKIKIKTGVTRDGVITARQMTTYWDTGAYADCGPLVARNSGFTAAGPYRIPNVSVDAYSVYTNLPVATAFRGYGIPHLTWAYECHTDHLARKLGMDPLEFRLRNVVRNGDSSHTGEVLRSVGMKACLEKAAAAAGWVAGKPPRPVDLGDGRFRGLGLACSWKGSMRHYGSAATVRIMEEGSVEINVSNVDMGQGSSTIFAQMVVEEIGVPLGRVRVQRADTFMTPYDRTTSASRGTFHAGTAVRAAARDAWRQIQDHGAKVFGCAPEEVYSRDGKVVNPKTGEGVSHGALLKKAVIGGIDVIGRGYSQMPGGTGLDLETGQGANPTSFWMYAAQIAEIEADTRTGQIKALKVYAASDVGKAINPVNCQQQIEGAVSMGLGIGLMEELRFDEKGRLRNGNLHDYKIPTAMDAPEVEALLVEVAHPLGPYGAKGLGEAPVAPAAPAVANAVYLATGRPVWRAPLKPETMKKIWQEAGEEV
ncbi:MAG: xanthine dehydrogenase family protein molybdopterin-binding subunit [Peptococcaceae bacterium]|nr:xanthine dehydrogenase family protein molybdopterin-binding subunit [Peptococcaceae bacterium]